MRQMYQQILVAIDGSRAARRALDEAIQLASAQQAALCLARNALGFLPKVARWTYDKGAMIARVSRP